MKKDNSHWFLGFFYYNKDDKRIFPPKRFGFGWTVNFANPISILVMTLIIIIIIFLGSIISK